MQLALEEPDDLRAIVNAILTLDALAGIIHSTGVAAGDPAMGSHESDDLYRDALVEVSRSFQVLRDAAASIKHGALDPKRKKARLVRGSKALRAVRNGVGLFQCGDRLGSDVIVIEFDPGPGYVRASDVIADSYRMLKRIAEGEPARTDEHDRGSFFPDGD
ncbi:hypothetical protein CIW48_20275 [Methylobacterium sp. P1-11]|uniref:hypothetical protein n=1 Tax=Methylobacterium sp. P1-11 TaxID=2024616 RepID=UPI0011EC2B8E|nr:hypothetical protein [Methylobacterium sp. P1-11]KAA0122081.1 hypothetical protein CIW48_20275 [Methylobacterium sp. P1-11]